MALGALLYSGELARILYNFETAGRGPQGWVAAEALLRQRHPELHANTIRAAMRYAREVWQTGQNYRQGNPGYVPASVPDARRPEREDPATGLSGGMPRPPPRFYHEGFVEIIDPNRDDAVVQRFGITLPEDRILSRDELERLLGEHAGSFVDRFLHYDPDRLSQYQFEWRVRIGGVYQGF